MISRYDKLIETACVTTSVKFSVAKAFVEVVSNYDPFLYEVDAKAWPQVVTHKEDWLRLFLTHFVNTLGPGFVPGDSELQSLYCAYYGLTKIRYDRIHLKLGFGDHPMTLLMDPAKNLFIGLSHLAQLIKLFPDFNPQTAWKLAIVAYFTDPARVINVASHMKNTLSDQRNQPAILDSELRKEFGAGSEPIITMLAKFTILRDTYLRQELSVMGMS